MPEHRYQTLRARFVAGIIDTVVVLPFLAVIFFAGFSEFVTWLIGMAMIVVNIAYFVIFHGRNGQTLGKRMMRVRVVRASDESPISYRQSLWRESPLIGINLLFFSVEALLFSLDPTTRVPAFVAAVYSAMQFIPNAWWILDAVTTLFNSKRRSIHDFIGETVVINE